MNILKSILLLLVIGSCLRISPQLVSAQEGTATAGATVASPLPSPSPVTPANTPLHLTVSPISINWETKPGQPVNTTLKVRNNNTSPETLRVSLGNFVADESGERPRLLDSDPNDPSLSWLQVTPSQFTVEPGEWQDLSVTFSPPPEAALSYYHTIILNRVLQASEVGSTNVQGAPAVLVLSTVDTPNAVRQLEVTEFKIKKSWYEFLPVELAVTVRNTGNVHVVPQGTIFIDGQGQQDLAIIPFNQSLSAVLPGTTREFALSWADGFPRQILDTDDSSPGVRWAGLLWDFSQANRLRIGKYTAHLLLVFDNGQRDVPVESYASTWLVPWRLLLAGLVVGILTLTGLRATLMGGWRWIRRIVSRFTSSAG